MIAVNDWVVQTHENHPDQRRITGHTLSGRLLTVVLAPTDDEAVWRPVTGWDATEAEIAYYWEETR